MRFFDHCDRAGIRNPAEFLISKMPMVYDWLKGAFPRGILPTDIDGEVEINGKFLRFEFKHESRIRNGAIPRGQQILFTNLTKTGFHTVFLIGFDSEGEPVCMQIYWPNGKLSKLEEVTKPQIRDYCERWARYAEKGAAK